MLPTMVMQKRSVCTARMGFPELGVYSRTVHHSLAHLVRIGNRGKTASGIRESPSKGRRCPGVDGTKSGELPSHVSPVR